MNIAILMTSIVRCYVGCNVGSPDRQSIHVLECDTETGAAKIVQSVKDCEGTTYFQPDRDGRYLYSVTGRIAAVGSKSSVVRFPVAADGRLGSVEKLADLPCEAPCHVSLTPDGARVAFAAYLSATCGTVGTDGKDLRTFVFPDDAMGTNRKRQPKAYAHQTFCLPDGRLGVCDLGCDRIWFFDPATMKRDASLEIKADPGDGPRHALVSKDGRFLFVLNELGSSVASYALPDFRRLGKWSMLSDGFDRWEKDGETLATKAAAIKLTDDGRILMASNRGYDSIAFYAVNGDGTLTLRNIAKLTGRFPRDFALMPGERFMVVGHKMSNEIQVYRFDRAACTLTPVGAPIPAWRPLCFAFAASVASAEETWPFAILRSYGSYADNKLFTERVFAAQERHPGLFGEIWFGGDGGLDFPAAERGRLAAEKNAGLRERCHKLGIAFSYQQGVTLNHGPDGLKRDFIPEDAWVVNRDGKVERGLLCCTSAWALDYQRETAKEIMRRLQPDSYWPDDDLRLLKGDWNAANICFCDRCVKLFGESYGKPFTRETLVKALNGAEASAEVRKAWSAFNGRNLGACAKVYREAADAVSPKTRLGIQIALSGNTVDGDSWKTMVEALAGEKGKAGTRPGGLYYTDFNPRELPTKMLLVAREAARSGALEKIGQICYEVENWPHVGGHKNAHAMMAECAWSVAVGCDSIAFYWGADQNGEDAASHDYWLDAVWAWRPFQLAVRDAFARTRLGGVAAYHGANHWATKGWANHDEGEVSALMSCGVPVTVTEAAPDALWLNERCVETLAESDLKTVFARPVLLSAAAFAALAKRFPKLGFTQKLALEFPEGEKALATAKRANGYELFPSGLRAANVKAFVVPKAADVKTFSTMTADGKACGTCVVPTAFGGKVVVAQEVPGHWPHAVWPGCRRRAILDALDAATPGGMPARLMTDGYSVAVTVRKTADGRTAGVFLFNLGLGETPSMEVAIRRGAQGSWRVMLPRQQEAAAEVVRTTGDEVVLRVPPLQGFSPALICGK